MSRLIQLVLCSVLAMDFIHSVAGGHLGSYHVESSEDLHGEYSHGYEVSHHSGGGHSKQYRVQHGKHVNFNYKVKVDHPEVVSSHGDHKHEHVLLKDEGSQKQNFEYSFPQGHSDDLHEGHHDYLGGSEYDHEHHHDHY